LVSDILILLGSTALVFIAALLFVNALEWLGHHLKLGSSFVGSILSPLLTSLPELIVILIALFSFGGTAGQEIGIGTIFGQPFMASSLSYGLVGIAALIGWYTKKRNSNYLVVDKTLSIPYIFITILFPLTLVPGFIHLGWLKYLFAIIFLGAFVFYMQMMYRKRSAELIEEAEELTLCKLLPRSFSHSRIVLVAQLVIGVGLLYIGSHYLVRSVEAISSGINVSPMALALIIIPAATAIPETVNALIWGFQGKDTLSLGSLVGEKILYSTFYPALGLFLTGWNLDDHAVFSVVATTVVSLILLYFIRKQRLPWYVLLTGIFFFVAYAILIFAFKA
jgi:cation:H+ antiporter